MRSIVYVLKHTVPVVTTYPDSPELEWLVWHTSHACLTLIEELVPDSALARDTIAAFNRACLEHHSSRGLTLLQDYSVVELLRASATLADPYDIFYNPPDSYVSITRVGDVYSGPVSRPRGGVTLG